MKLRLELTEREQLQVRQNSIERVLNNGAHRVEEALDGRKLDSENAGIFLEDVEDLKPVVCKIWDATRDAIFRSQQGGTHDVTLTTEELVFVVGALVETHRRYAGEHKKAVAAGFGSPYYAGLAYMADAYETLNAALPKPREEKLARNPLQAEH